MHLTTIVSNIANSGNWQQKNCQGKVAGENAATLWHYLRYLDKNGSGKAYISIPEVSEFFDKSSKQVKRWLEDGIKLGFFRDYKRLYLNCYVIGYTSTLKVARTLGIQELGAIAQIPVEGLRNLREYATKISALAQQRATEYRQYSKKVSGYKLNIAESLQPCGIASRGILFRTKRYLVCHPRTQLVGGAQKSIAVKMGRSEITVQRHLSKCTAFEKRQLATASNEHWIEISRNKLEHKQNLRIFKLEDWETPIKAYCCIYHFPEVEPRPQKYLRQKLKRILRNASTISSAYQSPSVCDAVAGGRGGDKVNNLNLSLGGAG